jgi:hypothetical protein
VSEGLYFKITARDAAYFFFLGDRVLFHAVCLKSVVYSTTLSATIQRRMIEH